MSKFTFQCVHCFKDVEADQSMVGQVLPCIYCHNDVRIPDPNATIPVAKNELKKLEKESAKKQKEIVKKQKETVKAESQAVRDAVKHEFDYIRQYSSYRSTRLIVSAICALFVVFSFVGFFIGISSGTVGIPFILGSVGLFFLTLLGHAMFTAFIDSADALIILNKKLKDS